jgi:ferric-dicitrate binding protein FerR (iron transport regulator)
MSEEHKKQIFDYIFESENVPEHIMEEFSEWLIEHEGDQETEYLMQKKWEEHSKTAFNGTDLAGLKKIRKTIKTRTRSNAIVRTLCAALVAAIAFGTGWIISSTTQSPVKETTLATADHSIGEFILPDGTKVYLNGNSRLTYPEVFADDSREVRLSGECFFEVRKDKGRPFKVMMNELEIEVLGTSFGAVNNEKKGLEEIILKSGSVKVMGEAFEEDITLKPNQILTYSSYEGKATVKATDAAESYKWYEEYLTFDNSRFSDILQNISKRYNIEVKTMTSTSMMDKRMSLTITSENLQAAMELITMLLPIRYEIIGNTLIIRDKYPNNN